MSKKILCLLIALLMLLTISCASAAEELDNSTLETVDEQEAVQSTIDDASLEIENDDADAEVLSDIADGNGTADSGFHIVIDVNDEYGDITITGEAYAPARGAVSINITNASGTVVASNFATLEDSRYVYGGLGFNLPKGGYAVNYHYYGDDIFAPRTGSEDFTVGKDVAGFDVNASVNKYGAIIINATLNKAATGNVTFRIVREGEDPDPSKDVNVTVENGNAIFDELTSFEKGEYTVYATYSGDDNYYKAYSEPMGVDVNKDYISPTYSLRITGNTVNFSVDLGVPATGNVTATYPDGSTRKWIIYDDMANYHESEKFKDMYGNLSVVVDYDGDDNYYGFYELYIDFFIKYNPDLTVDAGVYEDGEIVAFAHVNESANGTVSFKIKNSTGDVVAEGTEKVIDGFAHYNPAVKYDKGNYTVEVRYSGDDKFQNATSTTDKIEINKAYISPITEWANVTGNTVEISVDLGVPATGVVNVHYPNGNETTWSIENNRTTSISTFNQNWGNITIVLSYDGDENYYGFDDYFINFFVKYNADLNVTTKVDEYGRIKIHAEVNKKATGDVTFRIKNAATNETVDEHTTNVEGGQANYEKDTIFAIGNYNIEVEYGGSDTYKGEKNNITTAEITKKVPVIELETAKVTEYGAIFVKGSISEIRNDNVTFIFLNVDTGKNITADVPIDENGNFEYDELEPFEKGFYTVSIEYAGNATYYGAIEIKYLDVEKTAPVIEIISAGVDQFGAIVVKANITKGATGNVTFLFINLDTDKNFTVPIEIGENGTIEYDELEAFEKGYYNVQIGYAGDDNYYPTAENVQVDVNVTKIAPSLTYAVNVAGGEVSIAVTLPSDINGNLTVIYPSGNTENFTIKNGTASIHAVFMNETGDLAITALFAGNDKYYAVVEIIDFIIKQATLVKATSVSVVYQNSAKVTIKLTNMVTNAAIAGAPVEITVNGKTYKGTTDKNGNAVITIPAKMLPKKYTASVVYKGTDRLLGDVDECTFTVKKATPKVTAKKKTFKKSVKVKKYTITLKDNKGKAIKKAKVTIKVGKKTFKAKTNSKGKAVFKLKKLTKKAKYTAKVTYKGNKYFNKVTKKVKITIK